MVHTVTFQCHNLFFLLPKVGLQMKKKEHHPSSTALFKAVDSFFHPTRAFLLWQGFATNDSLRSLYLPRNTWLARNIPNTMHVCCCSLSSRRRKSHTSRPSRPVTFACLLCNALAVTQSRPQAKKRPAATVVQENQPPFLACATINIGIFR